MPNIQKIEKEISKLKKLIRQKDYIEKSTVYFGCAGKGGFIDADEIGLAKMAEGLKLTAISRIDRELSALKDKIDLMCVVGGLS